MRVEAIVRFGAFAAIIGGALRIASSFISYAPESAALETLYAVIDLGLLFGLMALALASVEKVGPFGAASFIVALAGAASIVGPDARMFGLDFYQVGGAIFMLGLLGVSIALARALTSAAALWLASVFSMAAAMALQEQTAFLIGGVTLGTGFIVAGARLLRPSTARAAAI